MRVLLVNGSLPTGGSVLSTHAFARALEAAGHEVITLLRSFDHPGRDWLHEQLLDASVVAPGIASSAIDVADHLLGQRARRVPGHGYPVWSNPSPEHSIARLLRLFQPHIVIGNSIDRTSWLRCARAARRHGVATGLFLREVAALGHLANEEARPDLLLANAEALVGEAADVGHRAFFVPSIVEPERCEVVSQRRVALHVNPQADFGLEVTLGLAKLRPDVTFVLQESWPLGDDFEKLERRAVAYPNVEVRRRRPPGTLYSDARVLLAPHRIVNRPRVVLEAQHNGIPVVAADLDGLREAVGDGGLLVPMDAPAAAWVTAFDEAWADPCGHLQARARAHAARPEAHAPAVVAAFESAMETIGVGRHAAACPPSTVAPALSVVVPAHNAAATLDAQLAALLRQEWDRSFEVIVVDNQSTDATSALVRARMPTDERLRLVEAARDPGAAYARNTGAVAARAAAIAFCDSDDVAAPGWVKAMGEALGAHRLVAGRVDVERLNPLGLARSRGSAIADGVVRCFDVFPIAHGCNVGVRKEVLGTVGGWDESAHTNEDAELCLRLWNSGVGIHYEPDALMWYRYRGSGSSQWEQAVRYGASAVDLARRLEVRQLPCPRRLEGWRNVVWLVRHVAQLLDDNGRPHWLWTAGLRVGRIRGSLTWRTTYL